MGVLYLSHPCQLLFVSKLRTYLQEVTGVTMTAFQKVSVLLLCCKVGNVAWDTNIQAIHDCQDQLWPAECAQVKISNYFFSVHHDFEISTKQKTTKMSM